MIEVFFSCDQNYVQHTLVAIVSMLENTKNSKAIRLYILDGGLTAIDKETITSELRRYEVIPQFVTPDITLYEHFLKLRDAELFEENGLTASTYFRLSIPFLLPPDVKKAIYLDSDLVVLEDISHLWELDVEDYAVLAVPEPIGGSIKSAELELPDGSPYFNAGVLLINVAYWREHSIVQKAAEFIQNYPEKTRYWDQDALNYVLSGLWKPMPAKWNVVTLFFRNYRKVKFQDEYYSTVTKPAIVHFTGPAKPWVYAARNPYKAAYYKYLAKTTLKSTIPANKSIVKFLRRSAGYLMDYFRSSYSYPQELEN